MYKIRTAAFALLTAVMLTGCAPKDDLADYEFVEPPAVEGVTAQTEFSEYDGNTEVIYVTVTNDRDERLSFNNSFYLQKLVGDEWKPINVGGDFPLLDRTMPAHAAGKVSVTLKDHVKLPLLPGQYRIWVGSGDGTYENDILVPAEFTVK